ncbi:hypothetical protein Mboo_1180 [Methanoregula boonei 6A8]|jgi:hypothetical protein|uniref:DUF3821 domain-containing protein n=1 Tax=Methanoregula boonei (strain DSM 21154 / JCM 14090 / 6A8) TaxID=456442 RepID=A7I7I7_METB6|nr:LPXTG cell wall anchor domain-containing protein [Methanoregula boonei]ABS55698.1 hypothetical protein Mboo_1180 [Methanoregula boonei 6A8]
MNVRIGKASGVALIMIVIMIIPVAASVSFTSSRPLTLAKGDHFTINGTGADNGTVAIWIVGKNYFAVDTVNPSSDGTFSYTLDPAVTRNFSSGQYAFIVQDPGANRKFEIEPNVSGNGSITIMDQGKTCADIGPAGDFTTSVSSKVDSIVSASNRSGVDDSFAPYFFIVEEPVIDFDGANASVLENRDSGTPITFSGTTNVGTENLLNVVIFHNISNQTMQPVYSTTTAVHSGTDSNTWSFAVSPGTFPTGDYFVTVGWQKSNITGTGTAEFRVVGSNTTGASGTPVLFFSIAGILAIISLVWVGVSKRKNK